MTEEKRSSRGAWRWGRRLILLVLVVAAALWGTRHLWSPAEVELVSVVERDVVETLLTTGRVTVRGMRSLGPELSGRVAVVEVQEGDAVEAGALLAALDDEDTRLALEAQRAALADAEAGLEGLRRSVRPVALVSLEQARLDRERADRELARAEGLLAQGLGSTQAVDAARDASRAAELAETRAAAEVRSLGSRGAEILAALARVEGARVAVQRAEAQRERLTLRAPVAGLIVMRDAEVGAVVSAGQPLFALAPDESVEIRIQPDERELAHLEVGQRAWVRSEVQEAAVQAGRVTRILPAIDPQRGTLDARITLDAAPTSLHPNLSVDVEVELRTHHDAPVVPASALREEGTQAWLLGVDADGRLVRREVEVGWRGRDEVALREGVSSGDRVLRDAGAHEAGRRVRIQNGTPR